MRQLVRFRSSQLLRHTVDQLTGALGEQSHFAILFDHTVQQLQHPVARFGLLLYQAKHLVDALFERFNTLIERRLCFVCHCDTL